MFLRILCITGFDILGMPRYFCLSEVSSVVFTFVILEGNRDLSRLFGHRYSPYATTDHVFSVRTVNPSKGRPDKVKGCRRIPEEGIEVQPPSFA